MAFDFGMGEELSMVVRTARELAQQQLVPALRASEAARGVEAGIAQRFRDVGLDRLELPEAHGGAGLEALARVLVNEELGAADPGAALALDPLGPALHALRACGDDALAELVDGRGALVTATEGTLQLGAERVRGSLPWVAASELDVLAVVDADGITLVREGLQLEAVRGSGLRAAGASALRLDDAPVWRRLVDGDAARDVLGRARLHVASLLLGVLARASEYARDYAQERVAFGKPIGHHQALAFLITDMHAAVELARLLIREAAWLADAGRPFAAAAASAFVEVVEASRFVGPMGVQVLGGHGFMRDHPVEKFNREARALSLMLGGVDAARQDAGEALCDGPLPVPLSDLEAG